jgi:hypothetical protein
MQKTSFDFSSLPILSAEKFADAVGIPIGVVEAQMDRRLLPVSRIGKRRFVNLELLRKKCISEGSL